MAFHDILNIKNGSNGIVDLYLLDLNITNIEFGSNTTNTTSTRFTTSTNKVNHIEEPIYLSVIKGVIMTVLVLILVIRIFYDFESIIKIKKYLHQVLKRYIPKTNKSMFFKKGTSVLPRRPSQSTLFTPSTSIPDIIQDTQDVELEKKSTQDVNTLSSMATSSNNNNRPPPSYDEFILRYQPFYVLQNLNHHIYFSKPFLPAQQPFQSDFSSTYINLE